MLNARFHTITLHCFVLFDVCSDIKHSKDVAFMLLYEIFQAISYSLKYVLFRIALKLGYDTFRVSLTFLQMYRRIVSWFYNFCLFLFTIILCLRAIYESFSLLTTADRSMTHLMKVRCCRLYNYVLSNKIPGVPSLRLKFLGKNACS